ncbi:MAG: GntR family transcriptional regulator [Acetobacteraceae bacterium]|nr:GntR family transcriptional regulator [Acetobacteraceae bacterium]
MAGMETAPPRPDAYGALRAALRDGTLAPGARLTEQELAARLGVSRTPVRQAIARLEAEGLLTRAGRGLAVSRPDHTQVVELYVMRGVLEGAAARLAAQHASEAELAAMAGLIEREAGLLGDAGALVAVNQRLHALLYLAAHNRYLLRSLELLSDAMALLPSLLDRGGRAAAAHEEHRALLRALLARDADGAEAAARQHAEAAQRQRLAWLMEAGDVPRAVPG